VYKGKVAYREEERERDAMAFSNAAHGGQESESVPFIFILSSNFKLRALL
jgi:hypothetical protein